MHTAKKMRPLPQCHIVRLKMYPKSARTFYGYTVARYIIFLHLLTSVYPSHAFSSSGDKHHLMKMDLERSLGIEKINLLSCHLVIHPAFP